MRPAPVWPGVGVRTPASDRGDAFEGAGPRRRSAVGARATPLYLAGAYAPRATPHLHARLHLHSFCVCAFFFSFPFTS